MWRRACEPLAAPGRSLRIVSRLCGRRSLADIFSRSAGARCFSPHIRITTRKWSSRYRLIAALSLACLGVLFTQTAYSTFLRLNWAAATAEPALLNVYFSLLAASGRWPDSRSCNRWCPGGAVDNAHASSLALIAHFFPSCI